MKIQKSAIAILALVVVLAMTCSFAQTERQEFRAQAFGCQFKLTKDKEVQVQLYQNPWRLTNVIDWTKK